MGLKSRCLNWTKVSVSKGLRKVAHTFPCSLCWKILFVQNITNFVSWVELLKKIIVKILGYRDDSAVKSTFRSCRGPEFSSQHPHSSSHGPETPGPGYRTPPRLPLNTQHACGLHTYMQAFTHAQKKSFKKNQNSPAQSQKRSTKATLEIQGRLINTKSLEASVTLGMLKAAVPQVPASFLKSFIVKV